jgi:hypothetical protein
LAALPGAACAVDLSTGKAFTYSNTLLNYDNSVTGNNPSGSFLSHGFFETDDMSLAYKYSDDDVFFETDLDLRIADDPKVESSTTTVKRFAIKFGDKMNDAVIGDYLASLSNYTLGTSIKGARYTHKFSDTLDATILTGTPRSSWASLWGQPSSAQFDRQFYGARVSKKFGEDGFAALNGVASQDTPVPPSAYVTTGTAVLTNQKIGSLDWQTPTFHNFGLSGESAYSFTNKTDETGATSGIQDGWAQLVKADYKWQGFKNHDEFERVGTGFNTNGGSATSDQIRWRVNDEYKFSPAWKAHFNYDWFHNNLAGVNVSTITGQGTQVTRLPELGVRYDGPDWRPSLSIEAKVRDRQVDSENTGVVSRTRSGTLNFADKYGPVDFTFDYDHQLINKTDGTSREVNDAFGSGVGSTFDIPDKVKIIPSFHASEEFDNDFVADAQVVTQIVTAKLALKFPNASDAAFGYNDNEVKNPASGNSGKRSYTAVLGWNIRKSDHTRIELHYTRNENTFSDAGKDYVETIAATQLSLTF